MSARVTSREARAAEALYASGSEKLEAEAQRIAGLQTRIERAMALAELREQRPPAWGWILGRVQVIWIRTIAALPEREARRLALADIPPGQAHHVENEVRRLFEARREAQG